MRKPISILLCAAVGLTALGACGGGKKKDEAQVEVDSLDESSSSTTTSSSDSLVEPSSLDAATGSASQAAGASGGVSTNFNFDSPADIAAAKGAVVAVYSSKGASSPSESFKNPISSGAPLVFLVTQRDGDWLKVFLNRRPNGSTGWIKAADVDIVRTDYRVLVELSKFQVTVMKGNSVFLQAKVGLGDPKLGVTPPGLFYITELLAPPNPAGDYGPYAYGLSGYSDQYQEFGGGPGQIGMHGTNKPGLVGQAVSHGCIRLTNENITKLAQALPLGTPVKIVS